MVKHLSSMAGRGRKVFDLFSDPRSWAIDYKTRWEQSYRMREVVKHGGFDIPGISSRELLVADLWNIWFLLTENGASDGWAMSEADSRRAEYPLPRTGVQLPTLDCGILSRRPAEGLAQSGIPKGDGGEVAGDLVRAHVGCGFVTGADANGGG